MRASHPDAKESSQLRLMWGGRAGRATVTVRAYTESDFPDVIGVAEDLPEWFDEHARRVAISTDIRHQHVFVAVDGARIVGFISLYVSEGRLNIGWIAVAKSHQRQGIGRRLLAAAEEKGRAMQIREIAVCTLGASVDYPPYEQTRAFYLGNGFQIYQRSTTDNPSCPEEWKLKKRL